VRLPNGYRHEYDTETKLDARRTWRESRRYLVAPAPGTFWRVAAITAIGVGLLHGPIFWVIRRRQRVVRQQSIEEIREMLGDVVKNKLSVIDMYLPADDQQMTSR